MAEGTASTVFAAGIDNFYGAKAADGAKETISGILKTLLNMGGASMLKEYKEELGREADDLRPHQKYRGM